MCVYMCTCTTLARLALCKKAAWDEWIAGGNPVEGPLYDAMVKTRADFRKRMRKRQQGLSLWDNHFGKALEKFKYHQWGDVSHFVLYERES